MNETRKQIIELIEPYMDKTLSEGCYIEYTNSYFINTGHFYTGNDRNKLVSEKDIYKIGDEYNNKYFSKIEGNNIEFYSYTGYDEIERETNIEVDKILGHYDITAVLKYIQAKYKKFETVSFMIGNSIVIDGLDGVDDDGFFKEDRIGLLPNKPLHLYSEQEEKDLLDLLLKLK